MPPVGPFGSTSRMDAFQASLGPVLWTSMANTPDCPRVIVAGPDFVTSSTGGTNVNCPWRLAVFTKPPSLVMNSVTGLPLASRKVIPNVKVFPPTVNVVGSGASMNVTRSVHPSPGGVGYGQGVWLFGVSSWVNEKVKVRGPVWTPSTSKSRTMSSWTEVKEGSETGKFRCENVATGNAWGSGIVMVTS